MADAHPTSPLQRLIEVASHDLRNPLSVILVNATVLSRAEPVDDARRVKAATRILSNVSRMNRMIADLGDLAFAKMGVPVSSRRVDLDLGELAKKAAHEARAASPSRSIAVECTGELRGTFDPERVLRALQTMLAIALKLGNPQQPVRLVCADSAASFEIGVDVVANPALGDQPQRLFEAVKSGNGIDDIDKLERDGQLISLWALQQIAAIHQGSVDLSASDGVKLLVRLPKRASSS